MQITTISFLSLLLITASFGQAKTYKIGALMWHNVSHDEEALAGFRDGMELSGLEYVLDVERAYVDEAMARYFLRKWKEQKANLILTIGTTATLLAMEETEDIPIVFTAVTNPVISGIAKSWDSSGRNVTGSSNWIDLQVKLSAFKNCVPHLKTLGVIYNPDNPVPAAEVSEAKQQSELTGIVLREATISEVNDIEKAISDLVEQDIDALWVPIENLVYSNMSIVGRVTRPVKLPVLSSTLDGATGEDVGLIAITVDYRGMGRLCVPGAIEILTTGKNPSDIPIETMPYPQIVVNANAAEDIDYTIPPKLLAEANRILKGFYDQKIVVAGTGDSQELLRKLAGALEMKLGSGTIEVPDSIGSSGGMKALAEGKTDIARVARPLKDDEKKQGFTYKLFAKAPVVFVVHSGLTAIDNITTGEIISIYSGKVNQWDDIGNHSGKIYAVTREPGDSCLKILNETLPGFADIPNPIGKTFYTTPETVAAIEEHKNTIGFVPLPTTVGAKVKILKVDGTYPSIENVQSGAYKFAVPLAVVYKGQHKGLAKRFVDFLYSEEAQRIIIETGSIPVKQNK